MAGTSTTARSRDGLDLVAGRDGLAVFSTGTAAAWSAPSSIAATAGLGMALAASGTALTVANLTVRSDNARPRVGPGGWCLPNEVSSVVAVRLGPHRSGPVARRGADASPRSVPGVVVERLRFSAVAGVAAG